MSLRRLQRSFRYAIRGLRYAWRNEQNFRIHVAAALIVLAVIVILKTERRDTILLLLLTVFVLTLELVNTALEKLTDMLEPRVHHYAEVLKDLFAAAILIASFTTLIIALIILWPYVSGSQTP